MYKTSRSLVIGLLLALLLISACEQNRFQKAETLFAQRRYASAIEYLDHYIKIGGNGALITRAELIRSASYYELGLVAAEKENYTLSIRLLKLANSELADTKLAQIYKILANQALENQDVQTALSYLSLIINETPNTDLMPEILQMRIKIALDNLGDKVTAWADYMSLYDRFPDNPFEILARPYILRFIELNIDEAVAKAANGDYEAALGELFQISRYPIANDERINREISNIYQEQAELLVQEQNYLEADRYFRKAIQYFPAKQASIEMRLREIASLYIEKGNSYLQIKDFDNALVYYRKTFEIIPDYALALSAIERVKTTQNNIKRAAELALEAEKLESAKKYADAQRLFQQAYQLDNLDAYRQNAITMGNLIEAERSPLVFAQKIIKDYKNGILTNRINAQKQALLKTYKADEIRDSGWKILLSPGQYKYEARYDLITPRDNIFFVWQVNLKDRSITPLNKMSEKLMQ